MRERRSLFPSDDALPTWLHTTLLLAIVSPQVAFCIWYGVGALIGGRLEPLSGPEFGQWLFGREVLLGRSARVAGLSLLLWAGFFITLAFRHSRFDAATRRGAVVLPWVLLALSIFLSWRLPA